MSARGKGGVCRGRGCLPDGVPAQRGMSARGRVGGCLSRGRVGGVCPSACWDTQPPVNRMTDRRL